MCCDVDRSVHRVRSQVSFLVFDPRGLRRERYAITLVYECYE